MDVCPLYPRRRISAAELGFFPCPPRATTADVRATGFLSHLANLFGADHLTADGATIDPLDDRWFPNACQGLRLRRIETHGEVERAFRRRQPVRFAVAAGIFTLEIERQ